MFIFIAVQFSSKAIRCQDGEAVLEAAWDERVVASDRDVFVCLFVCGRMRHGPAKNTFIFLFNMVHAAWFWWQSAVGPYPLHLCC